MPDNILEIRHLSKKYDNHTVLDNINLAIKENTILGLLGPNGAGKTSLIRIITQITAADKGEIYFKGELLTQKHVSQIGYLPEERGLYKKMTVGEQLIYLSRLKGLSKSDGEINVKHWIQRFQIESWWDKNVETLSKGMQQKVQFIVAVIHQPALLILDEPFSGFDPINVNLIKDEILNLRKNGVTIIFSTHRMESVEELCDDVIMINNASIVLNGKKSDIKARYRTNKYSILSDLPIMELSNLFEITKISELNNDGLYQTEIAGLAQKSNELIVELAAKVSIFSYSEKIPDMNKIFIDAVNNPNIGNRLP